MYVLVMADNPEGLPIICGCLAAEDGGDGVEGEGAVGEGAGVPPQIAAATVSFIRELPPAGATTAERWLVGLDGLRQGPLRLVGPWEWEAELREAMTWPLDRAGLQGRTVATVRRGEVLAFPDVDR